MRFDISHLIVFFLLLVNINVLLAVVPHGSQLQTLKDFSNILIQNNKLFWNYSKSNDCNSYQGLECNEDGMVTSLSFSSLNLNGYIPNSIEKLSSLESIYFSGNNFNGSIPSTIGKLKNLTYLLLGGNEFSGTIPKSISNLTSLTSIDLSENNFSGSLPSDIGKLNKLTNLVTTSNKLSGIIPSSITNLTLLTNLNLGNNLFYGKLPSNLSNLINLDSFLIYKNQMSGELPSELGKFANIRTLVLGGNYFYGELATELSNLPYRGNYNISFLFDDEFESNYYGFSQNCLTYPADWPFAKESQRSATECAKFCDSNSTNGACSGNGVCFLNSSLPTCICSNGYRQGNSIASCISVNASLDETSPPYSPSPSPSSHSPSPSSSSKNSNRKLGVIIGITISIIILCIVIAIVLFFLFRSKNKNNNINKSESNVQAGKFQSLPVKEFRKVMQKLTVKIFSLRELQIATRGFDESTTLGSGGFGTVFKGSLPGGEICAIKKAHLTSVRSLHDFQQEVYALAQVSHSNIVKLIGYCDQANENILVYEYAEKGSLNTLLKLHKDHVDFLNFEKRLQVAKDSAQALNYLHNFLNNPLIHRDVKSDNILLDSKYHAKVADFGLLKNNNENLAAIKTTPCGTPGYLDPEYFKNYKVASTSDVYSFGVVLLELITGKPPIIVIDDPDAPDGKLNQSLVSWALPLIQSNRFDDLVDPNLNGEFEPDLLHAFANLAASCLKKSQKDRPGMDEVSTRLGVIMYGKASVSETSENYAINVDGNYENDPNSDSNSHGVPFLSSDNNSDIPLSKRSPVMSRSFKAR